MASCTLDRIRTCGLLIRSQLLYPAELRGHYTDKILIFQQGKITLINRFLLAVIVNFTIDIGIKIEIELLIQLKHMIIIY